MQASNQPNKQNISMGHNKVVGVTIAFEKDEFEKSKMEPFKFLAE